MAIDQSVSTSEDKETSPLPKHASFLVLQGISSVFFKTLSKKLLSLGCEVQRINFCGGDWILGKDLFSRGAKQPTFLNYTGKLEDLADFYRRTINTYHTNGIILFGDCRPIHKIAISVAKEAGIPVYVFEEGYTRPNWITMEDGGANDHTDLPRTPAGVEESLKTAGHRGHEVKYFPDLPNPMGPRVRMDMLAILFNLLLKPSFRHYKSHRPSSLLSEMRGWAKGLRRKHRFKKSNAALIAHYETTTTPFFLIPLQLNSDYQIREHSPYASVPEFVEDVVQSFAAHGPKETHLLFKAHPLDNGMINYRHLIKGLSEKAGLSEQCAFIEGGNLHTLLRRSAGTVMINSTVGFAALQEGTATKVMGRALYDMEGLTAQTSLDSFWKKPHKPDADFVKKFIRLVRRDSQLYGDLFTKKGRELAATQASITLLRLNTYHRENHRTL